MAVKEGIAMRNVSAPVETWERLDRLAAAADVPRFFAFRALLEAGFTIMPEQALRNLRAEVPAPERVGPVP